MEKIIGYGCQIMERSIAPRKLRTLGDVSVVASYDPSLHDVLDKLMSQEQNIEMEFLRPLYMMSKRTMIYEVVSPKQKFCGFLSIEGSV